MSEIKDGGRAFPQLKALRTHDAGAPHTVTFAAESVGGMTLRDYFAAKALSGVLANLSQMTAASRQDLNTIAKDCYLMADAMLREREAT